MKTIFNICLKLFMLVFLTACYKSEPHPQLKTTVSWDFVKATSGSGYWWSVPTPNEWNMQVVIRNHDERVLMVVPDFLFLESYKNDVIAKGLQNKKQADKRKIYMPFMLDNTPEDTSASVERTIFFPAGNDMYTVIWTHASLHWKHNNHEVNWAPVPLLNRDSLQCNWQELNNYTFSMDIKSDPGYQLYLLGPVLYDSSNAEGHSYLLISKSDTCLEMGKQWKSLKTEIQPLTAEMIRQQIGDTTRSVAWRCYFISILWDQPRPVKNSGEILTGLFYDKNNPDAVRFASAYSLEETGNVLVLDSIKKFVFAEKYKVDIRARLLANLYKLISGNDFSYFRDIINNRQNSAKLRMAAADALKNTSDSLFITANLKNELQICRDAEEHYIQATAYHKQKLYTKAASEYTRALEIKEDYADALNGRGGAYISLGKIDKALADLKKAVHFDPTCSSYNLRGMCYLKKGQYELAVTDFNKAIELNPDDPEPYSNLGLYYITVTNDCTRGLVYLKQACKLGDCSQYELALEKSLCSD
jgi:Tfp pilus assembly protein PilF